MDSKLQEPPISVPGTGAHFLLHREKPGVCTVPPVSHFREGERAAETIPHSTFV